MRCFLTGGTGFLGGRIARLLAAEGHEVVALVRNPARAASLAATGARLHPGDLDDPGALAAGMRGCDAVLHVAGWYRVGVCDGREAQAINVDGTRHVLTAMRDLGIPRGVYTSTLTVHSDTHGELVTEDHVFAGRHLSVYDASKADAHALAAEFCAAGLPLVIVQPGAVYGPGDASELHATLLAVLRSRLPLLPRRTAFCWAHVDDVAQGHLLALGRGQPGQSYHLAGPVVGMAEAMIRAAQIAGVAPPRVVPPELLRAAVPFLAVLDKLLPLPPAYTAESVRVAAGTTYLGSPAKAERELGWRARDFWPAWEGLVRAELAALRS